MKKIAFLILLTIISCKSEIKESKTTNQSSKTTQSSIVTDFLRDITTLETTISKNPISDFITIADKTADKKIIVSKENIETVLEAAKEFKYCIITTGNHTIVKLKDISNCKPSGSWAACMPSSEGYIKKGTLNKQDNFLNYIIGTPDTQERIAYFFN